MKIKNIIKVLCCLICTIPFNGYTQSNWFTAFDSLYKSGNMNESILAAEAVYFSAADNGIRNEALIRKTHCYLNLKNYEQASTTLDRVGLVEMSDSFAYQYHLLFASTFYLNNQFENSLSEITKIDFLGERFSNQPQKFILKILSLNELYHWHESKDELEKLFAVIPSSPANDTLKTALRNSYVDKKIPHIKSLNKAQTLSTFMPGLGQIYVGKTQEGLVNFSLEILTLGFMGVTAYYGYYFTGVLIGYTLFQRFYLGGLHRLEFLVKEKNKELTVNYNQQIRRNLIGLKEQ